MTVSKFSNFVAVTALLHAVVGFDAYKNLQSTKSVGYYNGYKIRYPELHKSWYPRERMDQIEIKMRKNETASLGSIIRLFSEKHARGKTGKAFIEGITNRTGIKFPTVDANNNDRRTGVHRPGGREQQAQKLVEIQTEGNEAPNVVTDNDAEGSASSGKEGASGAGSSEKEGINEIKEGESKEAESEAEEAHEEEGAGSPTEAEGEDAAESIAPISNGEETAVSLELVAASVEAAAAGMSTVAASLLKDVVSKRRQLHNIEHPPGGGGLPGEEETGGHIIAAATDPGMDLEDLEGKILEEEDLSVTMEILVAVMESAAAAVSIGGALVANDVIQREKVAELALEERALREGEQPRYFRV